MLTAPLRRPSTRWRWRRKSQAGPERRYRSASPSQVRSHACSAPPMAMLHSLLRCLCRLSLSLHLTADFRDRSRKGSWWRSLCDAAPRGCGAPTRPFPQPFAGKLRPGCAPHIPVCARLSLSLSFSLSHRTFVTGHESAPSMLQQLLDHAAEADALRVDAPPSVHIPQCNSDPKPRGLMDFFGGAAVANNANDISDHGTIVVQSARSRNPVNLTHVSSMFTGKHMRGGCTLHSILTRKTLHPPLLHNCY